MEDVEGGGSVEVVSERVVLEVDDEGEEEEGGGMVEGSRVHQP